MWRVKNYLSRHAKRAETAKGISQLKHQEQSAIFAMKKTKITTVVASLLFASLAPAQDIKSDDNAPKTKLEAFEAKTGSVLIKGIQEIGSVAYNGSVIVSCREFTDAATGNKQYGIAIEVNESGTMARSNATLIDYDEIDSLLKGIDYITKVDKSATTLSSFEAIYKTRGDFQVTTFSKKGGEIGVAVQSGSIRTATAYLKVSHLSKVRELIENAKAKLDEAKSTPPKDAK